MSTEFQCFDDPEAVFGKEFCLNALSKDLRGGLELGETREQKCEKPRCTTLRTMHKLTVEIEGTHCDSPLAKALNGKLEARLFTAFDTDGEHRGFHAGDFRWEGSGAVVVTGRMSGVTNEGTHRQPIGECQKCDDVGIFEGRLCGQVVETKYEELKECQIVAAYRIRFDSSTKGGSGTVTGTLEGVIICPCRG